MIEVVSKRLNGREHEGQLKYMIFQNLSQISHYYQKRKEGKYVNWEWEANDEKSVGIVEVLHGTGWAEDRAEGNDHKSGAVEDDVPEEGYLIT